MATSRITPHKPKVVPVVHIPQEDLQEQIRVRAYERFLERGGEHGHDLEDWLQAEAELIRRPTTIAA